MGLNITFISDTHTKHKHFNQYLPGGDVIVCSGDISSRGYEREVQDFLEWYSELPYIHKIFIAGNHDFLFEANPQKAQELLAQFPNVDYLENSELVIDGVKFWGSPYSPRFFDWAFNVDRGEAIREHWLQIPLDTDILITHGPPYGIGDFTKRDKKNVGCEDLMDVVQSQINPKVHVFGHIHEGYGLTLKDGTLFINASVLNERYEMVNPPMVVQI
jgi:Icc-related predicted phosphoesterase